MNYTRLISVALALSILSICKAHIMSDSVTVWFRQSKTGLDTTYMGNRESLEHIREMVKAYQNPDSDYVLTSVSVIGGASPEGSVKFNDWLSRQRARRIFEYMDSRMSLPDSLARNTYLGRDWHGLRARVSADAQVPYRRDVLDLLDSIIAKCDSGEKDTDGNLLLLKKLHGGIPYLYLYRNIFPSLRQGGVVLTFAQQLKQLKFQPLLINCGTPPPPDIIPIPENTFSQPAEKPFYMALKTNMLADALALPEIGAEFYLGKNISIVGNWMYGWWDDDASHRYWRAYGGDLALRWWFGRAAHTKPLTGHHVGVYGGVVTYDFEFGGKGRMGGRPGHNLWDRCMHYVGLEYGYSLPVARRLNIDFTLGLGYMGGKCVEYEPCSCCYKWLSTKQKHWYGPTKLEVSLVWLIGRGNYNVKKGAK